MDIKYFDKYDHLSLTASDIVIKELQSKPDLLLCSASGYTPTGLYYNLANKYKSDPGLFSRMNIVKLDEWGGVSMDHPQSCESYLQDNIIKPLQIPPTRFLSFKSNPDNPEKECLRIQKELEEKGGIDLCILGLGKNGHIAFNEPGEYLHPYSHIVRLSEKSLQHQMAETMDRNNLYGLSLGMANILQSRFILMIVTGSGKNEVTTEFLKARVSTQLPASFLWLHSNVICLVENQCC